MKKINILMLGFLLLICTISFYSKPKYINNISYSVSSSSGIRSLYIPSDSKGAIGDKIYVELNADTKLVSSISLFLKPTVSNGGTIVYLKSNSKDLTRNPYFIIPEDVVVGEKYELTQVNVYKENGTVDTYSTTVSNDYELLDTGSKRFFTIVEKSESTPQVEEILLDNFDFPNNILNESEIENIPLTLEYDGEVDWASISFESTESSSISFTVSIEDISNSPYINLKNNNSYPGPGEYKVRQVFLCHNENGCSIYSSDDSYNDSTYYEFTKNLIINTTKEEDPEIGDDTPEDPEDIDTSNLLLSSLSFSSKNVGFGEKVFVKVKSNTKLESILLFLEDSNKNTISAYLKDVNDNPYFVIPSNVEDGKYFLSAAIVKSETTTTEHYTNKNSKVLDLNSSITINNSNIIKTDELIISNDSYKESNYTSKFENLDEDAIITVTASSNSLIDKSLFELIKETRRKLIIEYKDSEWVFNGTDIKKAKTIDASILITNLEDSKLYDSLTLKELPSESKVVNFVNNGELPGKVLMKIKSDSIDALFKDKNINIYYYDKDEDNFEKVALEVQKNNGYYEFYINHNSSYLLSTKKLKDSITSKDTSLLEMNTDLYRDNIVEDEPESSIDIISILLAIIVVLLIAIFIVSNIKGSKPTHDDYE